MTSTLKKLRGVAVLGVALASGACGNMGQLGDVLGGVMNPNAGGAGGNVAGQVRYVDTQRQQIQFTTQDNRTGTVYFDRNTRVVYQQREYPVTALEAGDQVAIRIRQDAQGQAYTDYIEVTRSIQEQQGTYGNGGNTGGTYGNTGNVQSLQGQVGRIDESRGMFEVRTQNGNMLWVALPYNAHTSDVDRFRRLRSGDVVRVQGRLVSQDRFELDRFQ